MSTLGVRFAARGWLPAWAFVRAEQWSVPGQAVQRGKFYLLVRGDTRLDWQDQKFATTVTFVGVPLTGQNVPPPNGALFGRGDLKRFTIRLSRLKHRA